MILKQRFQWGGALIVMFAVAYGAAALSGCAPLKKKFTRKKDPDKIREVIPVLDPIDYPAAVDSPESMYAQAYSLWKVWHRELIEKLDTNEDNEKYITRLFTEDVQQLEKMAALLQDDAKRNLGLQIDTLRSAMEAYAEPAGMRNISVIKRKLRGIDKEVRNGFAPKAATIKM